MPIGIVSEEEFNREIKNSVRSESKVPEPIIEGIVEDMPTSGRAPGDVNVPDSIRKVIADTSLNENRSNALAFARSLGISDSSTAAYSNGATSTKTYDKKDDSLNTFLKTRKGRIAKKASKVLGNALGALEDVNFNSMKPIDAANIAKTMSSIVKDMEPEQEKSKDSNATAIAQIVLYAPPIASESQFEVVQASE